MVKQNLSKQNKEKVSSGAAGEREGASLLKKSELSLIFLGAGLLTLIVFFIFFSSSDDKNTGTSQMSENVQTLEKRIINLEEILDNQGLEAEHLSDKKDQYPLLASYKDRVEKVEVALSVKFDSVTERLDLLEKKISYLLESVKTATMEIKRVKKISLKKRSVDTKKKTPKKTETSSKKTSIFYTVKKGDTLYSISKKYKITVAKLKTMNKLTEKSKIYPGDNLIVK